MPLLYLWVTVKCRLSVLDFGSGSLVRVWFLPRSRPHAGLWSQIRETHVWEHRQARPTAADRVDGGFTEWVWPAEKAPLREHDFPSNTTRLSFP